jgi:N-methylhydantoinase B
MTATVDPITLEVIKNSLSSASGEMGVTLRQTSCSPIFNEGNDYSCAIFDPLGQIVSHGEFLPIHLGSLRVSVHAALEAFAEEGLLAGDSVLMNDPYLGGSHLPDITLVTPIFYGERLVGFAANRAHHLDVGGAVPGSFFAAARENYQEGLRIPPIKLFRAGTRDLRLIEFVIANSRLPEQMRIDLESQVSANRAAYRRVVEMIDRYGEGVVSTSMRRLLDVSERRMREVIAAWPDGEYQASDFIDNDGITDEPREIKVTVRIQGDEAEVDFTGSAPQVDGPFNSVLGYTYSGVYMTFQAATDPDISPNAGCYRPITVIAPEGTIVNPRFPAACNGGNEIAHIVHNTVFRALAGVSGESRLPHVMACDHGTSSNMLISGLDPRSGERYVIYEYPEGGWGGNRDRDGLDAVWAIVGNTWNVPVEVVEQRFPVRVERYELRQDSGGAGEHRGGLSIRRDHRVLGHRAEISIFGNRQRVPPWGYAGGGHGAPAGYVINQGDATERPAAPEFGSKAVGVPLDDGEVITQLTAGGGGWGDPRQRDPMAVARDVRMGYVSPQAARDEYAVALSADGTLDEMATAALRGGR